VARAAALSLKMPLYKYIRTLIKDPARDFKLPIPLINVVNGGKHSSSNLDLQEFWIIPKLAPTFRERLRQGSEIFHHLGALLQHQGLDIDVGNEGGYAPNFKSHQQVFQFILEAIEKSSVTPGQDVFLGLDAGASVFYDTERKLYRLKLEHSDFTSAEFVDYMEEMVDQFPFLALEDPLAEEDWSSWQQLTKRLTGRHHHLAIIGDDLFVTHQERLERGINEQSANAILIKPNQVGTLTETLACIQLAHKHDFKIAVSHRSGETNDSFIADLAVAVNAEYIKTGAPSRGERIAKYNRLLTIEQEMYG